MYYENIPLSSFETDIISNGRRACLLFIAKSSPPCRVMLDSLVTLCGDKNIPLAVIEVENKVSFEYIEKYSGGILPSFLFLSENKVFYKDYGTVHKRDLEKALRKVGFYDE